MATRRSTGNKASGGKNEGKAKASSRPKAASGMPPSPATADEQNGTVESQRMSEPAASGLSDVEFNARVARKAFELFERRGGEGGHDVEDWLEAERLVRQELFHGREAPSR